MYQYGSGRNHSDEKGIPHYCKKCVQGSNGIAIIRGVCSTFNERLKELIKGTNNDFTPLDMGCPSDILLNTGLPNLPIQISVRTLIGKKHQSNHPFKLSDVTHLPEYISLPIAVFRSASTEEDRKVILTEMQCNGCNIVVVISPNQTYKSYSVNDIRSIYPKDNFCAILQWVVDHNLLEYVHKEKFLNWLSKHQSNSDEVTQLIKDTAKIIQGME